MNGRVATTVEELENDTVRLTVDVPAHDVHHAVEHATNDLAASVKIPGFRQGKVPQPILVQRLGKERIYAEAVDSHISGWFWNAAASARIRPIAQPQFDYELPTEDSQDWRFQATVPVQPKVEVVDWTTLEVGRPEAEVPEELVAQELEALRETVAELIPAGERAARNGDTLVVDLISPNGDEQRDTVVELGAGRLVEEVEAALRGSSAGETKSVTYELADESSASVEIHVKEIKEKVLPELDDELARSASEFDTLAELRADIESRLGEQLAAEIDNAFRANAVDTLVRESKVNPSGPLVESRARELLNGFVRSLERRGIAAETYLELTGRTPQQLVEAMTRRSGPLGRARAGARGGRGQARDRGLRRRGARARARAGGGGRRGRRSRARGTVGDRPARGSARGHPAADRARPRRRRGAADRDGRRRGERGDLDTRQGKARHRNEVVDPR